MPKPRTPHAYLLVEGEDDQHVVWHLCEQHNLPEQFTVEIPEGNVGLTGLLAGIPSRVKTPGLRTLGIMIDADADIGARWQAVRDRLQDRAILQDRACSTVPAIVPPEGWVSSEPWVPRVGVWLMPDNQRGGMLEDFAASLIPGDDALLSRTEAALRDIEEAGLRRYRPGHRPKALIHTWLAWQENPGHPMGTAIKAGALHYDAPLARAFVAWLRRLFDL